MLLQVTKDFNKNNNKSLALEWERRFKPLILKLRCSQSMVSLGNYWSKTINLGVKSVDSFQVLDLDLGFFVYL